MPDPVAELLRRELDCEAVLTCGFGLTALDRECYRTVAAAGEASTVDAVAERVDRERTTAYRSVQRLVAAGVVRKDQVNDGPGGYHHVYTASDSTAVATALRTLLEEWHAEMQLSIATFEETVGAGAEPGGAAAAARR